MANRQKSDQYLTHVVLTKEIVDDIVPDDLPKGIIVEPSAGIGTFVMPLRLAFPNRKIVAIEIDPFFKDALDSMGATVRIKDFFDWKPKASVPIPLIIGNPPFSLCEKFVQRSLELTKQHGGKVIFLLRAAFLETAKRLEFVEKGPLKRVIILSHRPSFIRYNEERTEYTYKGADRTMYAIFEWDWEWEHKPYLEFMDVHWSKEIEKYEAKMNRVEKPAPEVEK